MRPLQGVRTIAIAAPAADTAEAAAAPGSDPMKTDSSTVKLNMSRRGACWRKHSIEQAWKSAQQEWQQAMGSGQWLGRHLNASAPAAPLTCQAPGGGGGPATAAAAHAGSSGIE